MSRRYVGRVRLAAFRRGRFVGRARADRTLKTPAADGAVARGVAVPAEQSVGVRRADDATELLQPPDVTGAIFVDGSGRRGRRLGRAVYALLALALVLLLAFWVLQGVDVFGWTA